MYKRKKAVTLLETVIYLGLLSIVIGLFSISTKYFKVKENEIKIEEELLAIKYFIIDSKIICREQNKIGVIYFDMNRNTIKFKYLGGINYLKLDKLELSNLYKEIDVNGRGLINKNYEFWVNDKNNKIYKINISKEGGINISNENKKKSLFNDRYYSGNGNC